MPSLVQNCTDEEETNETSKPTLNQTVNDTGNITDGNETRPEGQEPKSFGFTAFFDNVVVRTLLTIIIIVFILLAVVHFKKKSNALQMKKKMSDLDKYICACIKEKKTEKFVFEKLKSAGWPEYIVKNRIKEVGKDENLQTR